MKLIGITGKKGSGKDAAAQILLDQGYELVKFAAPLKDMLRAYLRYHYVPADEIERHIEGDKKEKEMGELYGKTCRFAMQTLGTEWGRDIIGKPLWTNAFAIRCSKLPKVVCTDVRFLNEAETIKELGGKLIHIVRPSIVTMGAADFHTSETEVDQLPVDAVIINNTSIKDLQNKLLEQII